MARKLADTTHSGRNQDSVALDRKPEAYNYGYDAEGLSLEATWST